MRKKPGFSLGKYTTVSQTEVHAIKTCAVENIGRDYRNISIVACRAVRWADIPGPFLSNDSVNTFPR
jgi:hypothetical protein